MDTERKKNKTDKDRLVAGTDGWDAPACGPGEGSPCQRPGQAKTLVGMLWTPPSLAPPGAVLGAGVGGRTQQPRGQQSREPRAQGAEQGRL